jgi:hypothetical protein
MKMHGVDDVLCSQIEAEKDRWRAVLKRLLEVIKLLSTQNLALRGHVETLDVANPGNFIAVLKLLSKYDPVMANHFAYIRQNPRCVSYLSHDIQNEFIALLATAVRGKILDEIREAKYFGILFDSTPDISHTEQLSEVIRYVRLDYEAGKVEVREAFIDFLELENKDAAGYEEIILKKLKDDDLKFSDCRAQMYDNAAVMSGHISGVQARLCDQNAKAIFVNCDNHSLNLAGLHAASVDPIIITFFGTVEQVYVFFSGSTIRWKKMTEKLNVTVKRESDTRWSARESAVRVIAQSYDDIIELLQEMNEDALESADTREKAGTLLNSLLTLSFVCFLLLWEQVLHKINVVQKRLQSPRMNLREAATDLDSLIEHFISKRSELCQNATDKGLKVAAEWDIPTERRIRRKKKLNGEKATDAGLTLVEEIDRVMKLSLDRLVQEIRDRSKRLQDLNSKFGFLLDVQSLITSDDVNEDSLLPHCADFALVYEGDIDGSSLLLEIMDCRMLFKKRPSCEVPSTPEQLLKATIQYGKEVFPNLRTALQILLTISVSVASCERSFSKLKLVKTYLRSTMSQERLSNLAILSIEKDTFDSINFDMIIDQFAEKKREKSLYRCSLLMTPCMQ